MYNNTTAASEVKYYWNFVFVGQQSPYSSYGTKGQQQIRDLDYRLALSKAGVRRRECVYVKLIFKYGQSVKIGKEVDRMPVRDRKHILSILKKHKNKRNLRDACDNSKAAISSTSDSSKISTSSVNKDWENFVVLHGKPETVKEDVRGIGKKLGVEYVCETSNCFNLLTKKGRREWRETGGG
jgi:hypothetical protein